MIAMTRVKPRLCAVLAGALMTLAFAGAGGAQTLDEANALLAAEDYDAAEGAFNAVLEAEPENANATFGLARALQEQEEFDAAAAAFDRALAQGYQPPGRVLFHRARMEMTRGDEEAALARIEELAAAGAPIASSILAASEFEPLAENERFQAAIEAMRPCATERYRDFDFWLGRWDVAHASGTSSSEITSAQGGCAIIENYASGAFTGMSINFYDAQTERWHQAWMSNAGGAVHLQGGLNEEGAMVMTDADLLVSEMSGSINRVTWSVFDNGDVRQFWESSSDGGETWSVVFDGRYSPAEEDEESAGE